MRAGFFWYSRGLLFRFSSLYPKKNNWTQGILRQKQAEGHGRKSHTAGKRQGESWGIDGGDGHIPAAVLGKLAHKNGFQ